MDGEFAQVDRQIGDLNPTLRLGFQAVFSLFDDYLHGRHVDPYALTKRLDDFEATCERLGFSPWRPDTVVGALTRRLRNEVMGLADYLRVR